MTRLEWGSATHVGRVRQVNQDSLIARDDLVAVADGMGGHRGGEVASAVAVETLEHGRDRVLEVDDVVELIQDANRAVLDKASGDPELAGMGTTVVVLGLVTTIDDPPERLAIANVGDSRGYSYRADELEQITDDHSLVESLVREGRITREEAEHHPNRNIVTRALGIEETVLVDVWDFVPVPGDRYLLCSDGLFNEVPDNQIAATLRRLADPGEAADELVRLANEGGGRDNITVVVADVVDDVSSESASEAKTQGVGVDALTSGPIIWNDDDDDGGKSGHPRVTWRVVLFIALLVAVVIGGIVALGVYARGAYYVGFDDSDEMVIYQGRPGGVAWFEPTIEQRTGVSEADLDAASVIDVEAQHELDSFAAAERLVESLTS